MLDTGSQPNLITEKMVQHLRLKWKPDHLPIIGTNGSNSYSKGCVDTIISSSVDTQFEMPARFRIVPKITSSQPPTTINTQGWTNLSRSRLLSPWQDRRVAGSTRYYENLQTRFENRNRNGTHSTTNHFRMDCGWSGCQPTISRQLEGTFDH